MYNIKTILKNFKKIIKILVKDLSNSAKILKIFKRQKMNEEILNKLKGIIYPGFKKNIVDFGFVKATEPKVIVQIPSAKPEIKNELEKAISALGLECEILTPAPQQASSSQNKNIAPQIKNFIMISSGKGGVGKSTTTLNLALSMAKMGKKIGILDADIYGPNIPRMLGCENERAYTVGDKLKPIISHGLEMMSMGVLIEPGQSLIWRGAMIMKAITQLLNEVAWGNLDALFLDMPPGTGDAQLTLAQSVPVSLGVCVTTPQSVALDDCSRALDMFSKLGIKLGGVVENMSGFICPDSGKKYDIFGGGEAAEKLAQQYGTNIIAKVPIEPSIREGGDLGKPVAFYAPNSNAAKAYDKAAAVLWDELEKLKSAGGASNSSIQPH